MSDWELRLFYKYNQDIKRGRPRKYKKVAEIGEGINITEVDRRIFRIAIAKFYNNRKGNFLTTAYELMLKEYYIDEIVLDERGARKSILIPPGKRPTIVQFRYWYDKEHKRDVKKLLAPEEEVELLRYNIEQLLERPNKKP